MQNSWRVKIADRTVEMTLDDLVAAYEAGRIEKNTPVIEPGELQWTTLAAVADLSEDPAPLSFGVHGSLPLPAVHTGPPSIAPMATDIGIVPPLFGFGGDPQYTPYPPLDAAPAAPKRRVGKIFGVVMTYVVLIAIGAGAGAYRAAPGETRARVSALQSKLTGSKSAPPAAAAAAPPPVVVAAPPAPAPTPEPVVIATPTPTPTQVGTSVSNLPTAKPAASTKAPPAPRRPRR